MAKKVNNVFINENNNPEYGKILMDSDGGKPVKQAKKTPHIAWRILRPVVIVVISLVVIFVISMYAYDYAMDRFFSPVDSASTEVVEIEIPSDSSLSDIAEILSSSGIIKNEFFFKMYTDFSDMSYKLKAGTYTLSPSMTYDDVIYTLIKGEPAAAEITLTFADGITTASEAKLLAESEKVSFEDPDKFAELCKTGESFENYDFINSVIEKADGRNYVLDGYLFPDTYRYYSDATEEEIIIKQLNRFDEIFTDEYRTRAEELGMTVDDVVILASIIQAEAIPEDFSKVSAVFHNRLNSEMTLGSCATMKVVTGKDKYTFTAEELEIDSPYNTYMYTGLPVGPVCNPGKEAIEAALYPYQEYVDEQYLYFCLTTPEEGKQVFAKTYEEHLENQSQWESYWS